MSRLDQIHAKLGPDMTSLPDFASILIVEDQRFDRTRLKRLISGMEIDTHVAEADCLERMGTMLQIDKSDLVLLDYNLPDGNGLLGLDAIRLDPKNRNAAVIMITGDGQSDIAVEALKRGCSDYVTKDELTPDAFRRATINALQKSRLSIGIETHDTKRQNIESVLQRFSSECAGEIKPVVSRMMRQLRDLRDAPRLSPEQIAERHARIEQSCMRLWEFLNDLDEYSGSDMVERDVLGLGDVPGEDGAMRAPVTLRSPGAAAAREPFPVAQTAPEPAPEKPRRRGLFGRPLD